MTEDNFSAAKAIFLEALQLAPEDRLTFVRDKCGDDPTLLSAVESLLAEDTESFGVRDADVVASTVDATAQLHVETPQEPIGPYRILEVIGEGGMGVVYAAEQREPVQRKVALKVIKHGMDTKEVVARFEAERQALALMEHPSIAKVLDAGATPRGRPYFVMEYVAGEPLTTYCDRHRLQTKERLSLFRDICDAVQHAHQKGVIHRDLKPSNILVEVRDGRPFPKIIDFGVAKSTQKRLTEKTVYTQLGALIGTPAYMSPEQAEMTGADIDTRTDVYALGVVLYELLVGALPFDTKSLLEAGYAEIQRVIREVEPPKPSTRLSSLGNESHTTAVARRSDTRALTRALRGDLDWIVMKCLEKDRTRRYPSASELSADIGRHLAHEPVVASPPSAAYRLRKFVRKNRAVVTSTLLIMAALLGGMLWALSERDRAEGLALSERTAKEEAIAAGKLATQREQEATAAREAEAKRAKELQLVTELQQQQLAGIDVPLMGVRLRKAILDSVQAASMRAELSDDETAERLQQLDKALQGADWTGVALGTLEENIFVRALAAINETFKEQPLVRARLLHTVAKTTAALGLIHLATEPQQQALEIRRRLLGDDAASTLDSIDAWGSLLQEQGKLDEAEVYLREAVDRRRKVFGDRHLATSKSVGNLGILLYDQGKYDEAEPFYRESLEVTEGLLGDDHDHTLTALNNLGVLLSEQGELEEAEHAYRKAFEKRRESLGADHPDTITSASNLGSFLSERGRPKEAEPYVAQALQAARQEFGDDHPTTLLFSNNLGHLYYVQRRLDEAESNLRSTLAGMQRVIGSEHPLTLTCMSNLAATLTLQKNWADAEPYYRQLLAAGPRVLGKDHPDNLLYASKAAIHLKRQGNLEEAEQIQRKSLDLCRNSLGDEHPRTVTFVGTLASILSLRGQTAEAESLYREALETGRGLFGDDHPDTVSNLYRLTVLLRKTQRWVQAEETARKGLKASRTVNGDDDPDTLLLIQELAYILVNQQKGPEAVPLVQELLQRKSEGKIEESASMDSTFVMGHLLQKVGSHESAESYFRKALEEQRRILGVDHRSTILSLNGLAESLRGLGRLSEAEPVYQEALAAARRVLGDKNELTTTIIDNFGWLLEAQGKPEEAEPYYREALQASRDSLGNEHPETILLISNMGGFLRELGKNEEADRFGAEAVELSEKVLEPAHPLVGLAKSQHGQTLWELKQHARGVAHLEAAHQVFANAFGEQDPRTIDVLQGVIHYYEEWHKLEPTAGHEKKAATWKAKLPKSAGDSDG